MNIDNQLVHLCKVLNKHSVQYLIVGGAAVAIHGYARSTTNMMGIPADKPDYDFWYNPVYANYFALLNVIEDLGQDVSRLKEEKYVDLQKAYFHIQITECTIDFLPRLKSLNDFKISFSNRIIKVINDVELNFIGFEDLLQDKISIGRKKDIDDINNLKNQ